MTNPRKSAATMLTGDAVLANIDTRTVLLGTITLWTDNKSRSLMIVKNPMTGNEERITFDEPETWKVLQEAIHLTERVAIGTPMLEVER